MVDCVFGSLALRASPSFRMPDSCGSSQFFSAQCLCRLGQKTKSRWHQPRRAVQPGRVVCSRSSFLAPRCHPFFDAQGTWNGTTPCSARVCPASRWGRLIGSSRNIALLGPDPKAQVEATSHSRLATGRNSRLFQEFIWPCSLSIVQSLGAPSPKYSPHFPRPPIAKLPWLSPPILLQS